MEANTDNRSEHPTSPPLVYDLNEVAEILRLSTVTVRRLISRGQLARVRSVRRVIVPRAEVERFVAENSAPIT